MNSTFSSSFSFSYSFSDASSHHHKKVYMSIPPSVCPTVCLYIDESLCPSATSSPITQFSALFEGDINTNGINTNRYGINTNRYGININRYQMKHYADDASSCLVRIIPICFSLFPFACLRLSYLVLSYLCLFSVLLLSPTVSNQNSAL